METMQPITVANEEYIIRCLAEKLQAYAVKAITKNGVFRVGLSGGSMAKYLTNAAPLISTHWEHWRFFFCDERYVPESDPESTFGVYKKNFIPEMNLEESQFFKINLSLPLDECAKEYEENIRKEFNVKDGEIPIFDVLLLGMGPDGHTCSLFPGHELLNEKKRLIAPIYDSPKPPPQRITMTFPIINNARAVIFAISGAGKADIFKKVFIDREDLPAAMVTSKSGNLVIIFDEPAGIHIPVESGVFIRKF